MTEKNFRTELFETNNMDSDIVNGIDLAVKDLVDLLYEEYLGNKTKRPKSYNTWN